MKQSVEITEGQISEAITLVGINLTRRLTEKGRDSFVNPSEALGEIVIRISELQHAVQIKEPQRIIEEFMNVAVGCIVGVASIKANAASQDKKQGEKP